MQLAIFDDDQGRWGPLCEMRPAMLMRTGPERIAERVAAVVGMDVSLYWTPQRLAGVTRDAVGEAGVNSMPAPGRWLLVNGRWNGVRHADAVRELARSEVDDAALVDGDGALVAGWMSAERAGAFLEGHEWTLPTGMSERELDGRVLMDRPWHILDELDDALAADLPAMRDRDGLLADPPGNASVLQDESSPTGAVLIALDAALAGPVVLDARRGPVAVDTGASVGPFAVLEGPCYVGPGSEVLAHAHLRPRTVVGVGCRVGGEVSASVIDDQSNKAHAGYLGNSLIGQWCNLGAGTTTSNLKNTFGEVRVQLEPHAQPEPTGRQKIGCIAGDLVRTAIGTRLMTGSTIGTGCMLAMPGFGPRHAPPMGFYAGDTPLPHDPDALLATASRMMKSHDREPSQALAARLQALAQAHDASSLV